MLTEDHLRELIDSAAWEAPSPSPLADDLFHAEVREPSTVRHRRGRQLAAAAAAVVIVGFVAAVVPGNQLPLLEQHVIDGDSTEEAAPVTATPEYAGRVPQDAGMYELQRGGAGGSGSAAAGAAAGVGGSVTDADTAAAAVPAAAAAVAAPADSAKIVKTGALELRVGKGTVTESVNRVTALATGLGGYVSNTQSTTGEQSGAQASATITVRVPSASFEQLLRDASGLGEVRSTTTSGQDVTAQFTDIDAQLTALTGARDQFLLILGEANDVPDILAVQDRITQVQIQIDQLEGQKRLLTDQTTYGTLSVTLLEPGATAPVTPIDDNEDLGDAWSDARRNFGDALENIVGASGTLAVVFLFGAVTLGAAWILYRRARRHII